jgi:hypothetical protein
MSSSQDEPLRAGARWMVGCLVGAAALVGSLVLVLLITIALQPPTWVQVVVGVLLTCGVAALAWLVATGLRSEPPHRPGPPA